MKVRVLDGHAGTGSEKCRPSSLWRCTAHTTSYTSSNASCLHLMTGDVSAVSVSRGSHAWWRVGRVLYVPSSRKRVSRAPRPEQRAPQTCPAQGPATLCPTRLGRREQWPQAFAALLVLPADFAAAGALRAVGEDSAFPFALAREVFADTVTVLAPAVLAVVVEGAATPETVGLNIGSPGASASLALAGVAGATRAAPPYLGDQPEE